MTLKVNISFKKLPREVIEGKTSKTQAVILKLNIRAFSWGIVCFSTSIGFFQILNSKIFRIHLLHPVDVRKDANGVLTAFLHWWQMCQKCHLFGMLANSILFLLKTMYWHLCVIFLQSLWDLKYKGSWCFQKLLYFLII